MWRSGRLGRSGRCIGRSSRRYRHRPDRARRVAGNGEVRVRGWSRRIGGAAAQQSRPDQRNDDDRLAIVRHGMFHSFPIGGALLNRGEASVALAPSCCGRSQFFDSFHVSVGHLAVCRNYLGLGCMLSELKFRLNPMLKIDNFIIHDDFPLYGCRSQNSAWRSEPRVSRPSPKRVQGSHTAPWSCRHQIAIGE